MCVHILSMFVCVFMYACTNYVCMWGMHSYVKYVSIACMNKICMKYLSNVYVQHTCMHV